MKKVYIICLKAPKLQIDKYKLFGEENSVLSDFNEYYFKALPFLGQGDMYNVYLYAYTNHKDYAKEFVDLHKKKLFYIKETEFDNVEYNKFITEHKDYHLKYIDYADDNKEDSFEILSTEYEYDAVFGTVDYNIETDVIELCKTPYDIFEEEAIYALDAYLYTLMHDLGSENDERIEATSSAYYGYCVTPYGRMYVTHRINGPNMYVRLFMMLLKD